MDWADKSLTNLAMDENELFDKVLQTGLAGFLAVRPSTESQERVRYLLERNESGELTEDETAELERFGELEHLMQLVKARAQVHISDSVRAADD
jgi:hypothetical protein